MKNFISILILLPLFFSCQDQVKKETDTTVVKVSKDSTDVLADTVLENLNKRIRKELNNAQLYLERADYYLDNRDFESAKADLDRAYFIDTTALKPLLAYADYWLKKGKLGYTLSVLDKAKNYHPNSADLYNRYSELYLVAKDNKKSLEYADLAVKHDIYNARSYYLKGFNFLEMGDTNKAISSYQTAVEQNPEFFEAYLELGLLYASMDDDLALAYYDNALSIKPGEYKVLYSKGLYQQEHEMYNEAIASYHQLTKEFPRFREAHFNLGYVHMYYLKLYREATRYFTDAIEVDPQYYQAFYNRGYSFELMGDVNNAKKDYEYALSIKPDYTLAAQGLSRVNELMQR